jgi:uncharacterized protein YukE
MSRLKKSSAILNKARRRMAGLRSIDAALDMGNGLSVDAYNAKADALEKTVDAYNQLLSSLDEQLNIFQKEEKELAEMSDRMLKGVGSVYGLDSNEYEMAGGTRKSEKKRPVAVKEEGVEGAGEQPVDSGSR